MKGRPKKTYSDHIIGDKAIREYFINLGFPKLPIDKLETYIPDGPLLLSSKAAYKPDGKKWRKIDL